MPVRWALIDDGHETRNDRRLRSFAPDPRNFPEGWKPLLALRDASQPAGRRVIPPWSAGSATRAGFDFLKIDVQAANLRWYAGTANAVVASARNSRALEASVEWEIPHGMINCMAHNVLCLFNTAESAATRCSIDYHLNDADSISSHILRSFTNTLWMGWSVWPDHDMFHSSDRAAGRMMAVSKALSGAPISVSDAPADIDVAVVRPLCLADGRLLRPLAPAALTPDSTFLDALNDASRPYVVVAPLVHGCAAVVAYNLVQPWPGETSDANRGDTAGRRVSGVISVDEYRRAGMMLEDDDWTVPEEGLLAYDWYRGARGPDETLGRARAPRVVAG